MTPHRFRSDTPDMDAPEADAEWFAQAKPADEVLPGLLDVNVRLDADVVQAFQRTGAGWQTRLNEALREWLASHGGM